MPTDEQARALMVRKDTLLEDLPPLAGVPFGRFYVQSFSVHARIGHSRRTTLHDQPETVRSDLIGARLMVRTLLAEFRRAG
jgi:hypothetical protein